MMLLEAGADESALNRDRYIPIEIVGTQRKKGRENPEVDERICRALIKAFLYRSFVFLWPAFTTNRGKDGAENRDNSDAPTALVAAAKLKTAQKHNKKVFSHNVLVFRREESGEPPPLVGIFCQIVRYVRGSSRQLIQLQHAKGQISFCFHRVEKHINVIISGTSRT